MEYKYNFEEDLKLCIQEVKELREELRGLDLENPVDRTIYLNKFREHAIKREGIASKSYLDDKDFRTVGIGFLMDNTETRKKSSGKREEWNNAFKNYPNKPDFDAVYEERELLDEDQIITLFNHSVSVSEKILVHHYQDVWYRLNANLRFAITDTCLNGPNVVTQYRESLKVYKDTNFLIQIRLYDAAKLVGDGEKAKRHLNYAFWELGYNSNKYNKNGIKKRRLVDLTVANVDDIPVYTPIEQRQKVVGKKLPVLEEIITQPIGITALRTEAREVVAFHNAMRLTSEISHNIGIRPIFDDEAQVEKMLDNLLYRYVKYTDEIAHDLRQKLNSTLDEIGTEPLTLIEMRSALDSVISSYTPRIIRMKSGLLSQFNAELNEMRQRNFGITHYFWRTRCDDKVRESHSARANQLYPWNHKHDDGNPGHAFGCRCWAEPASPEVKLAIPWD